MAPSVMLGLARKAVELVVIGFSRFTGDGYQGRNK